MKGSFKPCLSVLPSAQRSLWPELSKTVELGFVLYGGTAIALRLGHRRSVDFDFFSHSPLNREVLRDSFSFIERSTLLQDQQDSLTLLVPYKNTEHVKVSFFGGLDFGRVGQPELTEDGILQVASLDDLMATKVKVVLQRAEAKDYQDIAAMVNAGISLSSGLASAKLMFGSNFQPSESLKALVYFNDGDLTALSPTEKNLLIQAVRAVRDLPEVKMTSKKLSAG